MSGAWRQHINDCPSGGSLLVVSLPLHRYKIRQVIEENRDVAVDGDKKDELYKLYCDFLAMG